MCLRVAYAKVPIYDVFTNKERYIKNVFRNLTYHPKVTSCTIFLEDFEPNSAKFRPPRHHFRCTKEIHKRRCSLPPRAEMHHYHHQGPCASKRYFLEREADINTRKGQGERALHDVKLNKPHKYSHLPHTGNYPRSDIGHHL